MPPPRLRCHLLIAPPTAARPPWPAPESEPKTEPEPETESKPETIRAADAAATTMNGQGEMPATAPGTSQHLTQAQTPAATSTPAQASAARQAIPGRARTGTLRFSCIPAVFQLILEEPNRYPPEHTADATPIPGQSSWSQGPLDTLGPSPATDIHPDPVELLLPRWTLKSDWDLRSWLFRWGGRHSHRATAGAARATAAAGPWVVALHGSDKQA